MGRREYHLDPDVPTGGHPRRTCTAHGQSARARLCADARAHTYTSRTRLKILVQLVGGEWSSGGPWWTLVAPGGGGMLFPLSGDLESGPPPAAHGPRAPALRRPIRVRPLGSAHVSRVNMKKRARSSFLSLCRLRSQKKRIGLLYYCHLRACFLFRCREDTGSFFDETKGRVSEKEHS